MKNDNTLVSGRTQHINQKVKQISASQIVYPAAQTFHFFGKMKFFGSQKSSSGAEGEVGGVLSGRKGLRVDVWCFFELLSGLITANS